MDSGGGSTVVQTVGLENLTEVLGCTLQEAGDRGQLHTETGFWTHVLRAENGQVFAGTCNIVRDSGGQLNVEEHGTDQVDETGWTKGGTEGVSE